MNTYTACKPQKTLFLPDRPPLLFALKHAVLICLAAAGCSILADCRIAAIALGCAVLLTGCIRILSSRRIPQLLCGAGIALGGILLTTWGVWRIMSREPLDIDVHGAETGLLIQCGFFAGGVSFISIPVRRIERAAKAGMIPVKAQCIASPPEQDCILWRYRVGVQICDWKEVRCASFFLPCMGDCCILYADPEIPEHAVRIDRTMAAAQILTGLLLLAEVITAAAANL
jgi:hypothetical protein